MPEDTACPCCRAEMTVIGEDTSERLDVIPAQFRVIVTKRPKLACRACPGTVVQKPAPARLIEGGIPTEAMVAHVAGVALCRSSAAVSPGADHGAAGRHHRAVHSVVLDGLRGGRGCPRGDAAARDDAGLDADIRRRDRRAGARSGPRADQTRLFLGDRRATIGRGAAAIRRRWFTLRARPGTQPRQRAARRLPRYPAVRWICRPTRSSPGPIGRDLRNAGFLLEPRAPGLLRSGQSEGADRDRNAAAHCRAL